MPHQTSSSNFSQEENPVSPLPPRVVSLGELVAAAFDRAELVTTDPEVAATLATRTLGRWLGRTGRPDLARRLDPRRGARPAPRRPGRSSYTHAA
jgi:hypothetical protein